MGAPAFATRGREGGQRDVLDGLRKLRRSERGKEDDKGEPARANRTIKQRNASPDKLKMGFSS
jgi:hypothetical protein